MTQEQLKAKKEILVNKGWKEVVASFDLPYFLKGDINNNFKQIGYYVSSVSERVSQNIFSIFGEELDDAKVKLLKSISPYTSMPEPPVGKACIESTWPFNKDYMQNGEAAFQELTYRVITMIVESLGTPINIYQSISFSGDTDDMIFTLDPKFYNLESIDVVGKMILIWKDIYVSIQLKNAWSDNGTMAAYKWSLYSNDIREMTNKIIHDTGVELNPKSYQLGVIDAEFSLVSFPEYINNFTEELFNEMDLDNKCPERFNILIEGPPGYGKTRWTHSFASEVLAPRGYLILLVDYSTLQDLIIPDYIDKVCIIINDADTLALDRDESEQGNTEQILAWLDGSRNSFIRPFYLDKRSSTITIMTANSTKKWDEAALRQGRIHKQLKFDEVKLCDLKQ